MKKLIPFLLMLLSVTGAYAQVPSSGRTAVPCILNAAGVPIETITTGGVSQTLIVGANGINAFQIQNLDTTEPMWISWRAGGASAGATGSYVIPAGTTTTFAGAGSYYSGYGFTNTISIVAATTGHKFSCDRW